MAQTCIILLLLHPRFLRLFLLLLLLLLFFLSLLFILLTFRGTRRGGVPWVAW